MPTEVIIKANQSLSGAIEIGAADVVNIIMPAAFTGTQLTFQAAEDINGTFQNVFDSAGNELVATVAASRYVVDIPELAGIKCLKVRSGTNAAPIPQAADRIITIDTK